MRQIRGRKLRDFVAALVVMAAGVGTVSTPAEASATMWKSYTDAADKARVEGKFGDATKLLESAVAEAKQFGDNDVRLANTLSSLGLVYVDQGKASTAEPLFRRALDIFEKRGDKGEIAFALGNLGYVYFLQDKYTEAEPPLKRAVEMTEAAAGKEHIFVARQLENLGRLYYATGQLPQAAALFERSLRITERAYKSDNNPKHKRILLRSLAVSMEDLAKVYAEQNRYLEAEALYLKAIDLVRADSGDSHPFIAPMMTNLGMVYRKQGRYADAEKTFLAAIELSSRVQGPGHVAVAAAKTNLAKTYAGQGKFSEAEQIYKDALAIAEKASGDNSANVATVCQNFAGMYIDQKNYREAEPLLRRALSIREKLFGAQHRNTLEVATELARLTAKTQPKSDEVKQAAAPVRVSGQPFAPVKDKWALIVGISNFKDPSINLRYAAKDATDFKNFLVSSGKFQADHVKLLTDRNATRQNILSLLGKDWLGRLANKDDLVVIYLSSHGSTTNEKHGVNFLLAHDSDKGQLLATGIPMQWLTDMIKDGVHADRVVLLLDVCHSGAATGADGEKGITRANNFDVEQTNFGVGQAVLCSSLGDQVSWESKRYENSVFTHRLIEALAEHGSLTPLSQAYAHARSEVESEVLRDRGEVQTPVLNLKGWQGGDPILSVTPVSPRPGLKP